MISTLRSSGGNSICDATRTARPFTWLILTGFQKGSIMCTWRTFFKSIPSAPVFVVRRTFIASPLRLVPYISLNCATSLGGSNENSLL